MVKDAEANAAEDQKFANLVQARNTADGLAHAAKKTLEDAGDKASEEEKTAIEAAIKGVEEAVQGEDNDAIDAATKILSEASAALAQKLYAEQAEAGQAEGSGQAAGDDAMDAEFEEVKEEKAEETVEEKEDKK
jgi:molecular chaperone DnaK